MRATIVLVLSTQEGFLSKCEDSVAWIPCPGCSKEISSKAEACPYCSYLLAASDEGLCEVNREELERLLQE